MAKGYRVFEAWEDLPSKRLRAQSLCCSQSLWHAVGCSHSVFVDVLSAESLRLVGV